MSTPYHAKYYAHLLTARLPSDSADKFGASLMSATVDLNPHQIDAALFAFRSPLSRGAVLADALIQRSASRDLAPARVVFATASRHAHAAAVNALKGKSGLLQSGRSLSTAWKPKTISVSACLTDDGSDVDSDTVEKLLFTPGTVEHGSSFQADETSRLTMLASRAKSDLFIQADARHRRFFDDEMEKLDRWAEDLKVALEREIKDLDVAIREAKREARLEAELGAKVEKHRKQKALESDRAEKRHRDAALHNSVDSPMTRRATSEKTALPKTYPYGPTRVTPPGVSLASLLEERGLTSADLARRMRRPRTVIELILVGRGAITRETAFDLESALGAPAQSWINREKRYRALTEAYRNAGTRRVLRPSLNQRRSDSGLAPDHRGGDGLGQLPPRFEPLL